MSSVRNSRRGEDHQLGAASSSDFQEHLVIGKALGIPDHHAEGLPGRPGAAAEYGETVDFQIVQDFAFQCVQIQVHVIPQPCANTRISEGPARSRADGVTIVFGPI